MTTELVEKRSHNPVDTSEAEDFVPNASWGTNRVASGEGQTALRTRETWVVRVCSASFPGMRTLPLEWQSSGVRSAGAARSPTGLPLSSPGGTECDLPTMPQMQQKFIQMLATLQRGFRSREAETEEETWDWDVVAKPPEERPVRQMIFHLVRRGYQQPGVLSDWEE